MCQEKLSYSLLLLCNFSEKAAKTQQSEQKRDFVEERERRRDGRGSG